MAFPLTDRMVHSLDDGHRALPDFGRRLRRLRRALGVKQAHVADLAGVDQATVSRWERGAILPPERVQRAALAVLSTSRRDDAALRRLVEGSGDRLHLVDEASHLCLAYSRGRAGEWRVGQRDMLGVSLWQFATPEIRAAEAGLRDAGWWDMHVPDPQSFRTSGVDWGDICIREGCITWERLYLADGTPARLVSGARA